MPRDSGGVYTLPSGYLAVTGETVQASQHNPPLEDISSALTGSLPRNGTAPMTAPLKITDGSVGAPSVALASDPTWGFYKTATGWGVAIAGVKVVEFGPSGIVSGVPIGALFPYAGATAPTGYLLCNGASYLRTDYAALFAAIGTTWGAADGTHFNVPDLGGRVPVGKEAVATRLTTAVGGVDGATLGAVGGSQSHTLTQAQLPTALGTASSVVTDTHTHGLTMGSGGDVGAVAHISTGGAYSIGSGSGLEALGKTGVTNGGGISVSTTITNSAGGNAHANVQPSAVCNYIIFAGV